MESQHLPFLLPGDLSLRMSWGPFLEGPETLSDPEGHNKISNLKFTELMFSHIFYMNKVSLYANFHADTLPDPKNFGALEKRTPGHFIRQPKVLPVFFSLACACFRFAGQIGKR